MKWPKARAVNWLKKHFGVENPGALSKLQAKTAFQLLFAHGQDPAAYQDAVDKAVAAGLAKG